MKKKTQEAIARAARILPKPKPLRCSEWADQHFYLSAESSGTEGRWQTLPYQRAMLDLMGGDEVRTLTVQKPKRVGYTKGLLAASIYAAVYKRRNVGIWQPTDSDADEFKKDEINSAMRDVPVFARAMLANPEKKSAHNTNSRVSLKGATLYIRGAKARRSFRRISLDVSVYDELSAMDRSIEGAGTATWLGDGRLDQSPYPKSIRGSTPGIKNECQIEASRNEADLVFYRYLPCPDCGEYHKLQWKNFHFDKEHLASPDKLAESARFACPHCGSLYAYDSYSAMDGAGRWMTDAGEWIDESVEPGAALILRDHDGGEIRWPEHVALWIWAAYSYLQPWSRLARKWIIANKAKNETGDTEPLKTVITEDLAETWSEDRESVGPQKLWHRRELYSAPVPMDAVCLTLGVDTQDDYLQFEVVAHGPNEEKWGIEQGQLLGDPSDGDVLKQLDQLRARTWRHESGAQMRILATGIDSGGHKTQEIYEYCRTRYGSKVYCLKGQGGAGVPIWRKPSAIKIKHSNKTVKLFNIGVDALKSRFDALLKREEGQPGYQHIPESYDLEWCKQATGETRYPKIEKGRWTTGFKANRARVEGRDCRVYANAAFHILNPRLDLLALKADDRAEAVKDEPKPKTTKARRVTRRGGYVGRFR